MKNKLGQYINQKGKTLITITAVAALTLGMSACAKDDKNHEAKAGQSTAAGESKDVNNGQSTTLANPVDTLTKTKQSKPEAKQSGLADKTPSVTVDTNTSPTTKDTPDFKESSFESDDSVVKNSSQIVEKQKNAGTRYNDTINSTIVDNVFKNDTEDHKKATFEDVYTTSSASSDLVIVTPVADDLTNLKEELLVKKEIPAVTITVAPIANSKPTEKHVTKPISSSTFELTTAPTRKPTIIRAPSPESAVTPGAKPEPIAKPEPKPEPIVDSKPVAKPEPKPEPIVDSKPVAKPEPKPEPIVDSKPVAKPEPKPEPIVDSKPIAKPEPKPEPIVDSKPIAKPEPIVDSKPVTKPEPKPEPIVDPEIAESPSNKKMVFNPTVECRTGVDEKCKTTELAQNIVDTNDESVQLLPNGNILGGHASGPMRRIRDIKVGDDVTINTTSLAGNYVVKRLGEIRKDSFVDEFYGTALMTCYDLGERDDYMFTAWIEKV